MTKKRSNDKRVNILLVEDEESFVDALTIGLDREGFDVAVARDGQQAVALFGVETFDIVLLDLMLPKMSGLDVCRDIRLTSSVPIIIVSAKSEEVDMVLMLELGADDYVAKPYRLRELVARIRGAAPTPGPRCRRGGRGHRARQHSTRHRRATVLRR